MTEQEYNYNYFKIAKGMELCECQHQALMHTWFVNDDIALNIALQYYECNVNRCKCEHFKIDTLWMLEEIALAKSNG